MSFFSVSRSHRAAGLVRTFKALFDPYRPERHYMRGPGPKWHAKHNPAAALADGAAH